MQPEYTTYQRSPHARVKCVECHIGAGANWFVKSKLSGSWQLVSVAFNLYPRPIAVPVHNLRPARETCEQCHWPQKFVGDRFKVNTHYQEDEANTEVKTVLRGEGGRPAAGRSQGIHWHVDPDHVVRYRSDEKRQTIYEVEMTAKDGTPALRRADGRHAGGQGGDRVADHGLRRLPQPADAHLPLAGAGARQRAARQADRHRPAVRPPRGAQGAATPSTRRPRPRAPASRRRSPTSTGRTTRSSRRRRPRRSRPAGKALGDIWNWNVFPEHEHQVGHLPQPHRPHARHVERGRLLPLPRRAARDRRTARPSRRTARPATRCWPRTRRTRRS